MRRTHVSTVVLVLSLLGMIQSADAYTKVSGEIGNSTWTAANSPYWVEGNVTVVSGATLTIESGTVVKFAQSQGLIINGALNATGVSFTALPDDSVGGDTQGDGPWISPGGYWVGIQINDGVSATIDQCLVQYTGVNSYGSGPAIGKTGAGSLIVTNSTVRYNAGPGLTISASTSSHTVSNNTISNSGNFQSPAVALASVTGTVVLTGNTIANNAYYGVGIYYSTTPLAPISGNTFSGNGTGGILLPAENLADLATNSYSDRIGVAVSGGTVTRNATMLNLGGVPYYLEPSGMLVALGVTLTITPGTVVKMLVNSGMNAFGGMTIYGLLNAQGATFTDYRDDTIGGDTNGDGGNSSPTQGSWFGFGIQDGGSATIDQCVVRYAGMWNNGPAVRLTGAGSLKLTNSTVSYSATNGVSITSSASSHTISNNTVNNNSGNGITLTSITGTVTLSGNTIANNSGYGLSIDTPTSLAPISGNTFAGNGNAGIHLPAENLADVAANTYSDRISVAISYGTVTRNTTMSNLGGVPYYLEPSGMLVALGVTLTITPGTVVKVATAGNGLGIYGILNSQGASFTDYRDDTIGGDTNSDGGNSSPTQGSWFGFDIQDGGSATIDQCVVRYAGRDGYSAIRKTGVGSLILTNSTVSYSASAGVSIYPSASSQTISNNTLSNNSGSGVMLFSVTGTVTLTGNTIANNSRYGLSIDAPTPLAPISGNTFTGNGNAGISLHAKNLADVAANTYNGRIGIEVIYGTVTRNTTMSNLGGVPYFLAWWVDVASGTTLTITPGTVVKVAAGAGFNIYGTLRNVHEII